MTGDAEEGLIPDKNIGAKGDPRDAQVSGSMPGVNIVNHAQAHQMQQAKIVGDPVEYPLKIHFWDEKPKSPIEPDRTREDDHR